MLSDGEQDGAAWIDPGVLYAATAVAGTEVETSAGKGTVHHEPLGNLLLPSGRLVAYDPSEWTPEPRPAFVQPVPAGAHRTELRIVRLASGDARTLCAVIRFGAGDPERWELALLPGQDLEEPGAGEAFTYLVEGGAGCFCDPQAAPQLLEMVNDWMDNNRRALALHEAMSETYVDTWEWANMPLNDGVNVVAFSTGVGDGAYPVWLGYRSGNSLPVVALNDFGLISGTLTRRRR